jgi:hypothetical protein
MRWLAPLLHPRPNQGNGQRTLRLISLGEVMLRLDPGEDRIHTARTLRVWEGGGGIT